MVIGGVELERGCSPKLSVGGFRILGRVMRHPATRRGMRRQVGMECRFGRMGKLVERSIIVLARVFFVVFWALIRLALGRPAGSWIAVGDVLRQTR